MTDPAVPDRSDPESVDRGGTQVRRSVSAWTIALVCWALGLVALVGAFMAERAFTCFSLEDPGGESVRWSWFPLGSSCVTPTETVRPHWWLTIGTVGVVIGAIGLVATAVVAASHRGTGP